MKKFLSIIFTATILAACNTNYENVIIPAPQQILYNKGGVCKADKAVIVEITDNSIVSPEGYTLSVRPDSIILSASTPTGLFYAHQSLDQLCEAYANKIPLLDIEDAPRFAYRGVMLDVSRHFYDKDFVIKQLRLWAKLKINRLHWHLTDGIGWRLQIDRYPELTDSVAHYTKEDIREVLEEAKKLHIDVIPEIEMFGHSEEVWKVYPQLFCTGRAEKSSEYCIGKEATFEFLQNVLDEVMELFPSEYIHIGGDEARKGHWEKCADCQRRMKTEGLKSTDELQSYGITRIGEYVHSKGKKIIGWDEIMEGGLAPGAMVMSWRGVEGGIQAAEMGHGVVMTPGQWCYINNCQDAPAFEPVSQGGYLPLSKVYKYDPAEGIQNVKYVMGVQANLWTEYVATPEHMEYMLYPRTFAIAEIGWTQLENKNFDAFHSNALRMVEKIRREGYNPFDLANEKGERELSRSIVKHKASGCKVKYNTTYSEKYAAAGDVALTDGQYGSWEFGNGWQGFIGHDMDVVIDLGKETTVKSIAADFGQWTTVEIWMPKSVIFEYSLDGREFLPISEDLNDVDPREQLPVFREFIANGNVKARYIRVLAKRNPDALGWLFIDEVKVE